MHVSVEAIMNFILIISLGIYVIFYIKSFFEDDKSKYNIVICVSSFVANVDAIGLFIVRLLNGGDYIPVIFLIIFVPITLIMKKVIRC